MGFLTDDNITFNGVIGALDRRVIDLAGSPVAIKIDRAQVCDYVTPRNWILK